MTSCVLPQQDQDREGQFGGRPEASRLDSEGQGQGAAKSGGFARGSATSLEAEQRQPIVKSCGFGCVQ